MWQTNAFIISNRSETHLRIQPRLLLFVSSVFVSTAQWGVNTECWQQALCTRLSLKTAWVGSSLPVTLNGLSGADNGWLGKKKHCMLILKLVAAKHFENVKGTCLNVLSLLKQLISSVFQCVHVAKRRGDAVLTPLQLLFRLWKKAKTAATLT